VSFIGIMISKDGVTINRAKTAAIVEWPTPTKTTVVKAFCATVKYYYRHIKDFSTIVTPLYELIKDNASFHWGSEHQSAFEVLKMRIGGVWFLCLGGLTPLPPSPPFLLSPPPFPSPPLPSPPLPILPLPFPYMASASEPKKIF
jgi:hypothetical protein